MSVSPLSLFLTFAKIGLFTFGGGYAMIPLIQREAAEKKGWVTQEDLLDVVAIAESTPGPIAINAATFIGRKTAGVPARSAPLSAWCFPPLRSSRPFPSRCRPSPV